MCLPQVQYFKIHVSLTHHVPAIILITYNNTSRALKDHIKPICPVRIRVYSQGETKKLTINPDQSIIVCTWNGTYSRTCHFNTSSTKQDNTCFFLSETGVNFAKAHCSLLFGDFILKLFLIWYVCGWFKLKKMQNKNKALENETPLIILYCTTVCRGCLLTHF